MASEKQVLGSWGENLVKDHCPCPKCKKTKTFKLLPQNFKCADLICDFCGFLAQVKSTRVKNVNILPKTILGAAWLPQKERMNAFIYFPVYLVPQIQIPSATHL
ncbi:DpnI domain-containing protein [Acinetobacter thermotolerans]|uniref:DpnI domain-containing protein n=1 Tax=Acinetobacter thermotolerans TaxID=3151487 RepID=UPI00325AF55F